MNFFLSIIVSFILISNSSLNAQVVKWYTFEEAVELNKKEPRKILIDLYTDWCGWCKVMDKQTFKDPTIAKILNEKYYPVKFNAESSDTITFQGKTFINSKQGNRPPHQLAVAIMQGKMSYPSIAFMSEENKFITVVPGFQKPADMEPLLLYISTSLYEKNINFEEYKKNFKSTSNAK